MDYRTRSVYVSVLVRWPVRPSSRSFDDCLIDSLQLFLGLMSYGRGSVVSGISHIIKCIGNKCSVGYYSVYGEHHHSCLIPPARRYSTNRVHPGVSHTSLYRSTRKQAQYMKLHRAWLPGLKLHDYIKPGYRPFHAFGGTSASSCPPKMAELACHWIREAIQLSKAKWFLI